MSANGASLPSGGPPWYDLDPETLRFLEVHETRAVAVAARWWRDLGDAVLLHSPADHEPFFNRLAAIRWPADPAPFDARLTDALALFAALDRRPHFWVSPGVSEPADIVARLSANGFDDLRGRRVMLLVREPAGARPAGAGVVVEDWHRPPDELIPSRSADLALVIGEAFGVEPRRWAALASEIGIAMRHEAFHACLVRADGEPVATGQRFTFDGASYLSSIGTRPAWQGRGFGALVTDALVRGSVADGCGLVYLGVQADNAAAVELYASRGFAPFGVGGADMLLR